MKKLRVVEIADLHDFANESCNIRVRETCKDRALKILLLGLPKVFQAVFQGEVTDEDRPRFGSPSVLREPPC